MSKIKEATNIAYADGYINIIGKRNEIENLLLIISYDEYADPWKPITIFGVEPINDKEEFISSIDESCFTTITDKDIEKERNRYTFRALREYFGKIPTSDVFESSISAVSEECFHNTISRLKSWLVNKVEYCNNEDIVDSWKTIINSDIIITFTYIDYGFKQRLLQRCNLTYSFKLDETIDCETENIEFTRRNILDCGFESSKSLYDLTEEGIEDFMSEYLESPYTEQLCFLYFLQRKKQSKIKEDILDILQDRYKYDYIIFNNYDDMVDVFENVFEKVIDVFDIPPETRLHFEVTDKQISISNIRMDDDTKFIFSKLLNESLIWGADDIDLNKCDARKCILKINGYLLDSTENTVGSTNIEIEVLLLDTSKCSDVGILHKPISAIIGDKDVSKIVDTIYINNIQALVDKDINELSSFDINNLNKHLTKIYRLSRVMK